MYKKNRGQFACFSSILHVGPHENVNFKISLYQIKKLKYIRDLKGIANHRELVLHIAVYCTMLLD